MTKYDPRKCGAQCDVCPLGPKGQLRDWEIPWKPVPPEHHKGSRAAVVSDMPSKDDVKHGHPFSGSDTGEPWHRMLWRMKETRGTYSIVNVVACGSAGNSSGMYQRLNDRVKRLNKLRASQGKSAVPHPEDCCRPRLLHDLKSYKHIVTLGKVANKAITGVTRGIDKVRGSPWGVTSSWNKVAWDDPEAVKTLLPTFNPRRISSNPVLFDRWFHDLQKAKRLRTNKLRWVEPASILWRPTPAEFREWRLSIKPTTHPKRKGANRTTKPIVCVDVETPKHPQGLRPRQIITRTIAFARWKDGIEEGDVELACISIVSTDGRKRFYSPEDEAAIIAEINALHEDKAVLKIGHNWLAFDCENIDANFGAMPQGNLDTLGPARAANPGISKGLKPVGRTYSDVGEWDSDDKEESIATGSTDDDELLKYNGTDTHVNLVIWPTIRKLAAAAGYFDPIDPKYLSLGWWPGEGVPSLCDIDHWRQERAIRCTRIGIWIDQVKRRELEEKFTREYKAIFNRLQNLLEKHGVNISESEIKGDDLNPNSVQALRWLYFDKWDLPALWANGMKDEDGEPLYKKKDFVTANGDRATSDIVHRHYIASGVLEDYQAEIMQLVRVYRRYRGKIVGTTLKPLAPQQPIIETKGKNKGRIKGYTKSWLYDDGRVHSKFSSLITSVNRWNSSGPNVQNIGNKKGQGPLKKVFAAPAGRIFYGADINQAHLFIIANVWKIPALCEAIRKGYDPHNYNAYTTFGKKFTGAPGYNGLKCKPDPGSVADAMRNTIKIFIYASVYGAAPTTVWSVLAATEFDLHPNWLKLLEDGNVWRVPWKEGESPMPLNVYHFIREAMPYIDMKPSQVAKLHEAWLKGQPEWVDAWQREIDFYKANGFVRSYLFGRSSGDLGDDQNKMINTATLTTETELMLMIEGRIEKEFPRDATGPGTGLIYQCHDSAAVEWALPKGLPPFWSPGKNYKRSDLPRDMRILEERFEEAFTLNIPGWEFPIRGEASIGRTLKEVT